MADSNSDDWLPPGWTVEVRVRKNGKRDKYYSSSTGLKFNSMVEVSRYLDKAQNNQVSITRISKNVVVEKDIAEGLPQGWIKKTRVTTKGATIRRDSYYIDPVSGYVFRSIKDAVRYLESGEIGRNAFKPKDIGSRDIDLEDETNSSSGVAKKPKLSASRVTRHSVMGQSSNLDGLVNDQQIPKPACARESMPLSEHNSSQCVMGTELTGSVPSGAECSGEKEGKVCLAESNLIPCCADGVTPEKQLPESAEAKHETEKVQKGQRKFKHKKEMNLPRRASKRLAGIQVDPVPELITRRRHAVKHSGGGKAVTNEDKSPGSFPNGETKQIVALEGGSETKCKFHSSMNTMESPQPGQSKQSDGNLCTSEKLPEKTVEERKSEKDQECYSFLPLENHVTIKEHAKDPENKDKGDAKLDYSLDLPLGELLTDPCIAFAIQTLTGVTFETSKNTQISSELSNSKYSETSVGAIGHDEKIKGQNVGDWKQGCNVSAPPKNLVAEHAGGTETDDKADDNSGSSESPFGISWMDPCIEFAVKTLTGNIPVEYEPNTENFLQQQFSSSSSQGHCDVALSGGSLNNLCQTDYYCSQYLGTQNPAFKQQSFLDPALPNSRSVGMGNSAGARLPQCGEDRRNGCQR